MPYVSSRRAYTRRPELLPLVQGQHRRPAGLLERDDDLLLYWDAILTSVLDGLQLGAAVKGSSNCCMYATIVRFVGIAHYPHKCSSGMRPPAADASTCSTDFRFGVPFHLPSLRSPGLYPRGILFATLRYFSNGSRGYDIKVSFSPDGNSSYVVTDSPPRPAALHKCTTDTMARLAVCIDRHNVPAA